MIQAYSRRATASALIRIFRMRPCALPANPRPRMSSQPMCCRGRVAATERRRRPNRARPRSRANPRRWSGWACAPTGTWRCTCPCVTRTKRNSPRLPRCAMATWPASRPWCTISRCRDAPRAGSCWCTCATPLHRTTPSPCGCFTSIPTSKSSCSPARGCGCTVRRGAGSSAGKWCIRPGGM
ncbi:hypothetical protein GALL_439350 [mine drainage metagenome]|uniref:Uncharacterized protein n=1 Tax=mine drainage metagenome TaxID=410659 RepID=A0A1J5PU91_9ZZZZ